jgi:membrane-bound inhibitor of C-type lysozyme
VAEAGEGTKPCAPELLSVETTGTLGQLKLTWSDPDDEEIVQYNIYRNTTSGGRYKNGQFVTSVNGDTFMFTDTGLADGTQYCYVVKAEYADGNESNESNEICATTLVPVE